MEHAITLNEAEMQIVREALDIAAKFVASQVQTAEAGANAGQLMARLAEIKAKLVPQQPIDAALAAAA